MYGAAVAFYESYPISKLSDMQKRTLGLHLRKKRLVHMNKAICLLSRAPFFDAFKDYLQFLYKLTLSNEPLDVPIERYMYGLIPAYMYMAHVHIIFQCITCI